MAVEDVLPSVLIIGLIYLLVRWLSKPKTSTSGYTITGVTPSMVDTVHSAFPAVPIPNIIYHLSKTRSAQATSEEILERGSLPIPPASFRIPPSLSPTDTPATTSSSSANKKAQTQTKAQSLIERYGLSSKVPSRKGKEKDPDSSQGQVGGGEDKIVGVETSLSMGERGGKWEDTREKRETELRDRKERMILQARRRMLEKQSKDEGIA